MNRVVNTLLALALLASACSTPTPTPTTTPSKSSAYDDLSIVALERARIPEDWEVGVWERKCNQWGCNECPAEGCWVGGEGECLLSFAVWVAVDQGLDRDNDLILDEDEVGRAGLTCMAYDPTEDEADPVELLESMLVLVFSPDVSWLKNHQ